MNQTPLPLTLYGGNDCDDTERAVGLLNALGIAYRQISIDEDPEAERFVIFINNGNRSTPTLVFGQERLKLVLTEPSDEELVAAIFEAGHLAQGDQEAFPLD